jgi:hypothetical protein
LQLHELYLVWFPPGIPSGVRRKQNRLNDKIVCSVVAAA